MLFPSEERPLPAAARRHVRLVQHGFEVQAVLLAQLGGFFLQGRQRLGRLVLEGKHGHVAVGFGGHAQHALIKHLREPLQEKRVALKFLQIHLCLKIRFLLFDLQEKLQ